MSVTREQVAAIELEPVEVLVDRGLLRLFARTVGAGETVHGDLAAARAAGYPDLVVPPTYFFSLENERESPLGDLGDLDLDPGQVLHGEQAFDYLALLYAGDPVRVTSRYADAYEKGGGRLQFLVRESRFHRGEELVARASSTLVVPRQAGGAA
jgi:hypothetical protein